jgi:hypothetical protein
LSLASTSDIANASIQKFVMGQESEFFYDMRQFHDRTWGGGVSVNTDVVYIPLLFVIIPIPIPTVWPNISRSTVQLRTAATNKIIFKSGIVESIEAFDGGSVVRTQNAKWDKLTGSTVLTIVNNNFDAPIYSYSVPAYSQYQGMGAAFKNIGLSFTISNVQKDPYRESRYSFAPGTAVTNLQHGDEILLFGASSNLTNPLTRVVFLGEEDGMQIFHCNVQLAESAYHGVIVRSGFRNQLSVSAGTITSLKDPTVNRTPVVYNKTVRIPVEQ